MMHIITVEFASTFAVEFSADANGSSVTDLPLDTCSRYIHSSDMIAKIAMTPWGNLCMGRVVMFL